MIENEKVTEVGLANTADLIEEFGGTLPHELVNEILSLVEYADFSMSEFSEKFPGLYKMQNRLDIGCGHSMNLTDKIDEYSPINRIWSGGSQMDYKKLYKEALYKVRTKIDSDAALLADEYLVALYRGEIKSEMHNLMRNDILPRINLIIYLPINLDYDIIIDKGLKGFVQ